MILPDFQEMFNRCSEHCLLITTGYLAKPPQLELFVPANGKIQFLIYNIYTGVYRCLNFMTFVLMQVLSVYLQLMISSEQNVIDDPFCIFISPSKSVNFTWLIKCGLMYLQLILDIKCLSLTSSAGCKTLLYILKWIS